MAAREQERIVAAHLRRVLVHGKILSSLLEPGVIDEELRAVSQGRVGNHVLHVPLKRGYRLVRFDVRGQREPGREHAQAGETRRPLLAQRTERPVLRERSRLDAIAQPLIDDGFFVVVRTIECECLRQGIEPARLPATIEELRNSGSLGALLNFRGKRLEDLPFGPRLALRGYCAVAEAHPEGMCNRVLQVDSFVLHRCREKEVGLQRGGAHTRVDHDHLFELRPEVLEERVAAPALPPDGVRGNHEQHLGVAPRSGLHESAPPATPDRIVQVILERLRHRRVAPLLLVPRILVATVVEVEERGRARSPADNAPLEQFVPEHLVRRLRVQASEGGNRGLHALHYANGLGDAALLLHAEEHVAIKTGQGEPLDAGARFAPVAREREEQAHRPLHEVAVVVLRGVESLDDLRSVRRCVACEVADDLRVDATDGAGQLRCVPLEFGSHEFGDGRAFRLVAIGQLHHEPAAHGGQSGIERERAPGRLDGRRRCFVPPEELVLTPASGEVVRPHEPPRLREREQGQVGLREDELAVLYPLFQNHLAHGEGERGIRRGLDWHELVGHHARRAVVGRYRDDAGAVVACFGYEVGVRNRVVRRVRVPNED